MRALCVFFLIQEGLSSFFPDDAPNGSLPDICTDSDLVWGWPGEENMDVFEKRGWSQFQQGIGPGICRRSKGRWFRKSGKAQRIVTWVQSTQYYVSDSCTGQGPWTGGDIGPFWFEGSQYFLIMPDAVECTQEKPCPMLVHLHGAIGGDAYSKLRWYGSSACWGTHSYMLRYNMGVVLLVPVLRDGGGTTYDPFPTWTFDKGSMGDGFDCYGYSWEWASWPAPRLMDVAVPIVQHILEWGNGTIDRERVWINGLSEGAAGAVVAALAYPDIFQLALGSSIDTCRNFSGAAIAGEERLAEDPSRKRRLKTLIHSRGTADYTDAYCGVADSASLAQFADYTDEPHAAHIMKHYSVELRVYLGDGHYCWISDMAKTAEYYKALWSTECPLEDCILSQRIERLLPEGPHKLNKFNSSISSIPISSISSSAPSRGNTSAVTSDTLGFTSIRRLPVVFLSSGAFLGLIICFGFFGTLARYGYLVRAANSGRRVPI